MTRTIRFDDHAKQETKFTTCYMCACRCGIKVTLEDGKVRFIQGTRDHPVNHGVLCAKTGLRSRQAGVRVSRVAQRACENEAP